MINSWTLSILRILFLSLFTSHLVYNIYIEDSFFGFFILIDAIIIFIDFFINQKIIFKDKFLVLFKHYKVKKIQYKDIKHIFLKGSDKGKFIGMCYDIKITLKDGSSILVFMGPLILFNKSEMKIKENCKRNGIKYTCNYVK
jgi:hypothetical protein